VNGFVQVRQNRVHGVTTTPTNHQVQKVDMSAQLALELEALRRRQPAQCLAAGVELPPIVFASDTGGYLDVGDVRWPFYRMLTKVGLGHIRFHDLRHTFASLLIQQGESLAYVRGQWGTRASRSPSICMGIWCRAGTVPPSIGWMIRRNHLQPRRSRTTVQRLRNLPQVVGGPDFPQMEPTDQLDASNRRLPESRLEGGLLNVHQELSAIFVFRSKSNC
jgi:hypothetical protein